MRRRAEYLGRCAFFNDPPEIHDEHALAEMAHHVQVVADEKERQTQLRAQVRKQIEDLRLHGNIERGDRLVGNDEIRPARKRAGNSDALALAARELVREPLRMGRIKTDQGKQFRRRSAPRPGGAGRGWRRDPEIRSASAGAAGAFASPAELRDPGRQTTHVRATAG